AGLLVDHPDQPARLGSWAAVVRSPDSLRLVLPDLLPQRLPLQADFTPGLLVEQRAVADQVISPTGMLGVFPGEAPPRAGPLADVKLRAQSCQELTGGPVALIEGQPVEGQSVGLGPLELFQSDLPLGAVVQLVGDARLAAALPVFVPAFGQK